MSAVQNKSDCLNAMYIVLFQLRPTSAVSAVIKYQSNFSSFNSALLSNKYLQKQQVYFQQATESNFSGRVSDMCVSCSQCDVRQVFAVMLSLLNRYSHHRCRTPLTLSLTLSLTLKSIQWVYLLLDLNHTAYPSEEAALPHVKICQIWVMLSLIDLGINLFTFL